MEKYLSKPGYGRALIVLVSLLVWGQTVRYGYVWDDYLFIVNNNNVHSLNHIPQMFNSLDVQSAELVPSFRPVRTALFAVLYAMGGGAPWIFHLANFLWHTGAALLLYAVALRLWQRYKGELTTAARAAALFVAVGFVAHPVLSEVVAWAKCLDDIMAAVFVLAAMWFLLGERGYRFALIFFVLGVYTKESAAPFALAAFFILYGFNKLSFRQSVARTIPFLLIACIYMAHRREVIGQSSQCPPLSGSYGQTLIDMFPVVTNYFRLIWGVPPFCIDYSYMPSGHPFFSADVMIGLFIMLVFAGVTVWMWFRPALRPVAFGMIWFALFLLPVSNLLPMMQYMAERFLYLPLVGILIALGGLILVCPRPQLAGITASGLVVLWICATLARVSIWHDELTLFVRTNLEHPGIARVEKNAVVATFRLPQMRALFPDYLDKMTLRMAPTLSPENAELVVKTLTEARRLFPNNELLATTLGLTYARLGQWPQANDLMEAITRAYPNSPRAWYNLASVYLTENDAVKARAACAKALHLNPAFREAQELDTKISAAQKESKK